MFDDSFFQKRNNFQFCEKVKQKVFPSAFCSCWIRDPGWKKIRVCDPGLTALVPDVIEDGLVGLERLHLWGEKVELPVVLEPVLGADAPALRQPLVRHPTLHIQRAPDPVTNKKK